MKTIKLTCPSCEAKLSVDSGHDKIFCPYCGTEFLIDDNASQLRRIEAVKLDSRKKNFEQKKEENKEKDKRETKGVIEGFLIMTILPVIVLLFYYGIFSIFFVEMPEDSSYYEGKNYEVVIVELKDLGFRNIETRAVDDLVIGLFNQDGDVKEISIGGKTNFEEGDTFRKSANVVIWYHTY